jgi:hypothetical protein
MLSVAALALGLVSVSARAESQAGSIDWKTHTIKCKGSAAPPSTASNISQARLMAEKAAKLDAMRNILETLKGVEISGARSASDALKDEGVKAKVEGVLKNFKVVDTRYFSDGGVEVDVEMPLGGLTALIVPEGARVVEPAQAQKSSESDVVPVSAPATKVSSASQH